MTLLSSLFNRWFVKISERMPYHGWAAKVKRRKQKVPLKEIIKHDYTARLHWCTKGIYIYKWRVVENSDNLSTLCHLDANITEMTKIACAYTVGGLLLEKTLNCPSISYDNRACNEPQNRLRSLWLTPILRVSCDNNIKIPAFHTQADIDIFYETRSLFPCEPTCFLKYN